jgi:ketosteroid isomerase-like protein
MTITASHPSRAAVVSGDETTVREFFSAWADGDVSAADGLVDKDVVLGPIAGLLYTRAIYPGRGGVAAAFGEIATRWDRFAITVEETWSRDGKVIAVVHLVFEKHGMSSGGPITVACRLRDGLITAVEDDAA